MKQYRIVSQHFVPEGETGEPDAYMDATQLRELKKLAGMPDSLFNITEEVGQGAGEVTGLDLEVPQATECGIISPVGTMTSNMAKERKDLQHEFYARPGTDLWFVVNFTEPKNGRPLRSYVEEYLKTHPEAKQRPMPGSE